ncbi:MAG: DNA-formamidopyrimidine glycosylase family protein, partial [Gaiellaceae bacterium]
MPELPEVETVRRQLEPVMRGRRLSEVAIDDGRLTRPHQPAVVAGLLEGSQIVRVLRRGKYLVFELDNELSWLAHLRMTGSFAVASEDEPPETRHARATLILDDGITITYRDVRRFGTWAVLEPEQRDLFFT